MFKSDFVKKLAVPVLLTKLLFTTGCNNTQTRDPKPIVQQKSPLETELQQLEKEYKLGRITKKQYAQSINEIFAKNKNKEIPQSLLKYQEIAKQITENDKQQGNLEAQLKQLEKDYESNKITGIKFASHVVNLLEKNKASNELVHKYKKLVDQIKIEIEKNEKQTERILEISKRQSGLEEPFSAKQIKEMSQVMIKGLKLGAAKPKTIEILILAMQTHNYKIAKKNYENLEKTIRKSMSEMKKPGSEFVQSASKITREAILNNVIDPDKGSLIMWMIEDFNDKIDYFNLVSKLLNRLDSKKTLSKAEIKDYTKFFQDFNKNNKMSKKATERHLELINNFNKLVDPSKYGKAPPKVHTLIEQIRSVLKVNKLLYSSYLDGNINPNLLSEFKTQQKSQKKQLRTKGNHKKVISSLNKVKNFLLENNLKKINFSTLSKGGIISQKKFIDILKSLNKLKAKKLSSLNNDEKNLVNRIKKIIEKRGIEAIVDQHVIGETLSLKEIEAMLSIINKIKK